MSREPTLIWPRSDKVPMTLAASPTLRLPLAVLGRRDEAFPLLERMVWYVPSVIELRADPLLRERGRIRVTHRSFSASAAS
jgi:hypothetical protein